MYVTIEDINQNIIWDGEMKSIDNVDDIINIPDSNNNYKITKIYKHNVVDSITYVVETEGE